jgi:pyruvate/2-oxoglutarate dehydrogenase complex dihydrolipoamide acyltransferase (E2) component
MEDVAGKMLEDFAERLGREVLNGNGGGAVAAPGQAAPAAAAQASPAPSEPAAAAQASPAPSEPAVAAELDLISVLARPLGKRAAIGLGAVALFVGARRLLRGRRTGLSVTVTWR